MDAQLLELRTDPEKELEEKQGELKLRTEQESGSRALLPCVQVFVGPWLLQASQMQTLNPTPDQC